MAESVFHMINVGDKTPTQRVAQAQGRIELSEAAFAALVNKTNPKGDVLALSEVAGILAAKSVPQVLPLCHPLPLEQVSLWFEIESQSRSVLAVCEVRVTAKTGAEMEALAGVNGALLCIYDLSKAVDPVLKITDIRLNSKSGGKSGLWLHPEYQAAAQVPASIERKNEISPTCLQGLAIATLTISDRASRGESEDRSGPLLNEVCQNAGAQMIAHQVIADQKAEIKAAFRRMAFETQAEIVISTGGTGLSPRDVTPECLIELCDRVIPGFGEALRSAGAKNKAMAWLSRSVAGTITNPLGQQKLLIALPGSVNAVAEGMAVLAPILRHALHTMKGGDHAVP